ncbi:hypothetical protein RND59_13490 [Vibrio ruber]|uniref:hypothetical protein n=1 Tax=Vibrio ruber TaxID=184755 RepID=UPI002892CC63|nr:hypothetical protein [Vibrio ruber]WNJ95131.1 hypothetical protein RND59_13490 [Vibrio ruber]
MNGTKINDRENTKKNIYLLSSEGPFINATASIYKKNLMYASFLCICLSSIGANKKFDSLFGLNTAGGNIDSRQIINILIFVIIYELIMLWIHLRHCKSQWFNKKITSNNNIDNFKSKLKPVVNNEHEFYTQLERKIKDHYQKHEKIIYELELKSKEFEIIGSDIIDMLDEHIDIADDIIPLSRDKEYSESVKKFTEQYALIKQKMEEIKRTKNYFENSKEETLRDNKWFTDINKNLVKLKENHEWLLKETKRLDDGYINSIKLDFCVPTLISIGAIIYSLFKFDCF